jgi:hypothetical protein
MCFNIGSVSPNTASGRTTQKISLLAVTLCLGSVAVGADRMENSASNSSSVVAYVRMTVVM